MRIKPLIKKFSYDELIEVCEKEEWRMPTLKEVEGKELEYDEFWVSDKPEDKEDIETHARLYNKRSHIVSQIANKMFMMNAIVMVKE